MQACLFLSRQFTTKAKKILVQEKGYFELYSLSYILNILIPRPKTQKLYFFFGKQRTSINNSVTGNPTPAGKTGLTKPSGQLDTSYLSLNLDDTINNCCARWVK